MWIISRGDCNILQDTFDNAEGVAAGVGHGDFWVKGGKASGLNTGALSKINAELVTALHKSSNTDRIRDMEV